MKQILILFCVIALFTPLMVNSQAQIGITCDVWDTLPMWGTSQEWNGTDWTPPEYWQLFWNGTGLTPPNETLQLMESFDFHITANPAMVMTVIVNPFDGEQQTVATSEGYEVDSLNGTVDVEGFSSGWYYFAIFSDSPIESRVFYFGGSVQTQHRVRPPDNLIGLPVANTTFELAVDGDISTDSITSFSETLDDDVLFYPDLFLDTSGVTASAGSYTGDSEFNTYTSTQIKDGTAWQVSIGAVNPATAIAYLNISRPSNAEGFLFNFYGKYTGTFGAGGITTNEVAYYDGSAWQDIGDLTSSYAWLNYTTAVYDPLAIPDDKVMLRAKMVGDCDVPSGGITIYLDYVEVTFYIMTLADSNNFAESFSDVSDWTEYGFEGNDATSTDGDVLTWIVEDNDNADYIYSDSPALVAGSYYVEIRVKFNTTGFNLAMYSRTADWNGGSISFIGQLGASTSWATYKFIHEYQVECVYFYTVATVDYEVYFDYIRIAPSTEFGWQHDGSTLQGVTGSAVTDGDKLNITGSTEIAIDTTATAAMVRTSYYPFLDISVTAGSGTWSVEVYDGSSWYTAQATATVTTGNHRYNIKSLATYVEKLRINTSSFVTEDYVKIYSIANFTFTESGAGTDDYLYVSSNILYSTMDTGTIELNHDPAISVAQATYSVYNLSTSGTAPEFSQYVSSWSTYSGDTRGATTSGTVTDIKLRFDSTEIISAIKFIEDGTAPSVVRSWANPPEPDDSESVTLSAVITDTIEVYTVKINAIVSPAGFSDVDYALTEGSNNLWSYTFSTLTSGHYTFTISASDGANTNALTEYAYIDFDVSAVAATTLSLSLWQINILDYHINIDWSTSWGNTTLKAYDNDTLIATGTDEDATLQFSKSATVGVHVLDFLIDGTASSIWKNNTKYEIAQTPLSVVIEDWGPLDATIRLTGTTNGAFNYYVYREGTYNTETGTAGTSSAFSFTVARNIAVGEHNYQVYFNSSSVSGSRWFNFSDTVSSTSAWQYIEVADQAGNLLTTDIDLDIYINGSLIQGFKFYDRTDKVYNITILDRFGDTLSEANYSVPTDREYDITINVYSFKVKLLVDGAVQVYITSSGGGQQSTWLGWNDVQEWWVYSGKTYQIKWYLDNVNHTKVKGTAWHYYPALDWDGNQVVVDSTWYTPSDSFMIEIDAFGIGYIYGKIPDTSGGGGGGIDLGALIDEFNPLMLPFGRGKIGLILVAFFGGLAYLQYRTTRRGPSILVSDEEEPDEPSGRARPVRNKERQQERKYKERQQ